MKYELLHNGRGILIDRAPVITDVNDAAEVSFLLPCDGMFIAVLIDSGGIKRQIKIENGKITLPTEIIQPQMCKLFVIEISDEAVEQTWDCEPLKISRLSDMLQSQWSIGGGMSELSIIDRLTEIEKTLDTTISALKVQTEKYNQAITAYNNAIEVINNLSERLTALESNYDPTVIKGV